MRRPDLTCARGGEEGAMDWDISHQAEQGQRLAPASASGRMSSSIGFKARAPALLSWRRLCGVWKGHP